MPSRLRGLGALALLTLLTPTLASEAPQTWPHPEDIPAPASTQPELAGTRPADILRFLMVRGAVAPSISPDGSQVAYRSSVTGMPQLWIVPAAGGLPTQLTFGRAVTGHRWHPEGAWILYATDRNGNERESWTLITPDGTREQVLYGNRDAFLGFGSFSADGEGFVFASTARNGTDFDVYLGEVASGEAEMVYEGSFGNYPRAWQPGGDRVLLTEVRGEDAQDLYLLDVVSGRRSPLFVPEVASAFSDFAWLPDGSGFYLATNLDREFQALAFYDMATRELQIVEAPPHDVSGIALADNGRYLLWQTNEGGYSVLHGLDRDTGRRLQTPELPRGVHQISAATRAPVVAVRANGPRSAGELFTWRLEDGSVRRITRATWAGLAPEAMAVPESVTFPARDGVQLQGLMYLPAGVEAPPLVLMVHGGPTGQARPDFDAVAQYLVQRGIAVFDLNFRGSTGFGKTFARLDDRRLRPDAVRDVADTLDFLTRDGRIDTSRAAIMGGSYGGFLTNAAVGEFPDRFDAAVSFVGVSDWVRALEEASPALKASDRLEYGDINDPDDRAFFREISPITRADRIRTPMVVLHGANDPRDPVTESDRLVEAVRANGVEVRYLRFPDEGHGIRRLANRVTAYRTIADFLDEKLATGASR